MLLRAFARCADSHPAWRLRIFGEGSERANLTRLAADLGLSGRVSLEAPIKEPERLLRSSSLFILSSRYEGFPMVLLEAMACGLPVVSFDCKTGPSEMIQDGVNGLLVPPNDIEKLARAMDRLMGNESERVALGKRAVDITQRFGLAQVMTMWTQLLDNVTDRTKNNAALVTHFRSEHFAQPQATAAQTSMVASTPPTVTAVEGASSGK